MLNAANEVSVESFLASQIRFPDIAALNQRVLDAHLPRPITDLDDLLEADRWARAQARTALGLAQPRAAASA